MARVTSGRFKIRVRTTDDFVWGAIAEFDVNEMAATDTTRTLTVLATGSPSATQYKQGFPLVDVDGANVGLELDFYTVASGGTTVVGTTAIPNQESSGTESYDDVASIAASGTSITITVSTTDLSLDNDDYTDGYLDFWAEAAITQPDP